jgi:hypothetical protein
MAQAAGAPTADEECEDAVTAAAHHVYTAYPDTLATVLEAMDWHGYPALRAAGTGSYEPSAVAWLTADCGCTTPCASVSATAPATS